MSIREKLACAAGAAIIATILGVSPGLAAGAGEGGGVFSTFGQSRAVVFGILGAGGSLTAFLLWFATMMGKRNAKKSVARYDAELDRYRKELRRTYGD